MYIVLKEEKVLKWVLVSVAGGKLHLNVQSFILKGPVLYSVHGYAVRLYSLCNVHNHNSPYDILSLVFN